MTYFNTEWIQGAQINDPFRSAQIPKQYPHGFKRFLCSFFLFVFHQDVVDTCRFEALCARCSTDCSNIPTGVNISNDTIPVCEELPTGTDASSSGTTAATLDLERGYYRASTKSRTIIECRRDAYEGGVDAKSDCASGYEGRCNCTNE